MARAEKVRLRMGGRGPLARPLLRKGSAGGPKGEGAVPLPLKGRGGASLCDALDSLLDTGVVVSGDLRIRVADVDLVYVALELVACSWETAMGPRAGRVSDP